jgi:shikimate 5-dehydrogenase
VLAPYQTPLLEQAEKCSASFANGTALWAEQAARKLEFFQGPPATPGQLASLGREIAGLV